MPRQIIHEVTIVTENSKDLILMGSVGGSTMTWLADLNIMIQIGVGLLTGVFLLVRIVHWLRHWNTSPTSR